MSKILIEVPYLEESDVNPDGSLKPHVNQGKPALLMVQGNFCGYCNQAKPAFQQLARRRARDLSCLTLQIDGEPSEVAANKYISKVNKSPGVPAYLGFNRNGKFVAVHTGGRDEKSLEDFAASL